MISACAWALVSASVLWGLLLSTKVLGRRPRPNWMLDLHRFLGGTAVVFTVVHVISVIGFGLSAVLGVWLLWGVVRSGRL